MSKLAQTAQRWSGLDHLAKLQLFVMSAAALALLAVAASHHPLLVGLAGLMVLALTARIDAIGNSADHEQFSFRISDGGSFRSAEEAPSSRQQRSVVVLDGGNHRIDRA